MDRIKRLQDQIKKAKSDSFEKVDLLNELFFEIGALDEQHSKKIARESYKLAKKLGYERGLAYDLRNKRFTTPSVSWTHIPSARSCCC